MMRQEEVEVQCACQEGRSCSNIELCIIFIAEPWIFIAVFCNVNNLLIMTESCNTAMAVVLKQQLNNMKEEISACKSQSIFSIFESPSQKV